jgi:hypothetical protein
MERSMRRIWGSRTFSGTDGGDQESHVAVILHIRKATEETRIPRPSISTLDNHDQIIPLVVPSTASLSPHKPGKLLNSSLTLCLTHYYILPLAIDEPIHAVQTSRLSSASTFSSPIARGDAADGSYKHRRPLPVAGHLPKPVNGKRLILYYKQISNYRPRLLTLKTIPSEKNFE